MSSVDRDRAVVLLLDCMEGTAQGSLPDAERRRAFATSVRALIDVAREAGIPVVRVDVEFRPGHLEVAPSNAFFSGVKAAGRLLAGSEQTAPMIEIADQVSDTARVVKRRIGAFAGSDLEYVLRGMGRTHIVLAGLVTRGAVLSTACLAADLDYPVTVVGDACSDADPSVHATLLQAVLPLRAKVVTVSQLEASLAAPQAS